MKHRDELNKLVVATLEVGGRQRARELYSSLNRSAPDVFRTECVPTFKSFVKLLNTFKDVRAVGPGIKVYELNKRSA